jgi:hypothetical protein
MTAHKFNRPSSIGSLSVLSDGGLISDVSGFGSLHLGHVSAFASLSQLLPWQKLVFLSDSAFPRITMQIYLANS